MQKKSSTRLCRFFVGACLIFALKPIIPQSFAQLPVFASAVQGGMVPSLTYADIVDLADAAPMVADVRIIDVIPLPQEQQAGVATGFKRLFIRAEVTGLIRGEAGISPIVSYLFDAPLDSRGKVAKYKKQRVILFARAGTQPGQIQLVARDAQLPSTPDTLNRIKSVLGDLLANNAPPRIIGLGDAFHVAGTIAGEGETQIFLRTKSGDPVSLSIIRRPGQPPQWAVALGEIVDEAARTPAPGSLLWYRLACGLPAALPPQTVRTLSVTDAEAARSDYRVVMQALGSCERNRASI